MIGDQMSTEVPPKIDLLAVTESFLRSGRESLWRAIALLRAAFNILRSDGGTPVLDHSGGSNGRTATRSHSVCTNEWRWLTAVMHEALS